MADNRSVTITIKLVKEEDKTDTTQQTGSTGATSSMAPTSSASSESGGNSNSTASSALGWAAMAIRFGKYALNTGIEWVEYAWNRNLQITDDYIGQRWKRNTTTQINRAISYAGTIGSYTAQGAAAGGPLGAAVGAILGSIQVTSEIAKSNFQGYDQQMLAIKNMTAQLEFTRSRAGWSTHAASIGEDL